MLTPRQDALTTGRDALVVEVGDLRFGIPGSDVREILRAVATAPLPGAPPGVEGVVDLRGTVVPVHDLRRRLNQTLRDAKPSDHLVIVETSGRLIGLRVDRAVDLVRIEDAAITRAADLVREPETASDVARTQEGLLILHDLSGLLLATPATAGVETLDEATRSDPEP